MQPALPDGHLKMIQVLRRPRTTNWINSPVGRRPTRTLVRTSYWKLGARTAYFPFSIPLAGKHPHLPNILVEIYQRWIRQYIYASLTCWSTTSQQKCVAMQWVTCLGTETESKYSPPDYLIHHDELDLYLPLYYSNACCFLTKSSALTVLGLPMMWGDSIQLPKNPKK